MSNKFSENFRLQLLTHDDVFKTREDAVSYINDYFKPEALKSEPAFVYYGDEKNPELLIAVGLGNRKVYLIDFTMLQEQVSDIDKIVKESSDSISSMNNSIEDIVNAVGLTFDDNKIKDKITYEPDSKDALISDAKNVSEAINILSKYVQKETLSVKESESVILTKDNGIIEANVRVSEVGGDDTTSFNDNIIGVKSDGLYASAFLDYNDETKQLTFITSGFDEKGVFKNDAYKKVFDLGKHTEIKPNNKINSPVVLTIKDTEDFTKEISGKLKISEDENNILEVQDGNLLVNGKANNIKYKDKTVAQALNELNNRTDILERDVIVDVVNTDTVDMSINKDVNGTTFIKSDVKLGSDKSIVVANGGLSVNIDFDVNTALNKLIVKIGDVSKELDLPGIDIVQSVNYDQKTNILTISFKNGAVIPVSLGDVFVPYNFDSTRTIELHDHLNEDGSHNVYGELKLRPDDNALSINDKGELFCSIDFLTDGLSSKLENEIRRAKEAEQLLRDDLTAEIRDRQDADNALAERITAIEKEDNSFIENIKSNADAIEALKLKDNEINEAISTLQNNLSSEETRAKSEENRIEERLNNVKAAVENNYNTIEELKSANISFVSDLMKLGNKLNEETTRATNAEENIIKDVATNATDIVSLKSKDDEIVSTVTEEIERAKSGEQSLRDDLNVEIKEREKADTALSTSINTLENKVEEYNTNINTRIDNTLELARVNQHDINTLTDSVSNLNGEVVEHRNRLTVLESSVSDNNTALNNALTDEVKNRQEEVSNLNAKFEDETKRAETAEQALDTKFTEELSKKIESVIIEKRGEGKYDLLVDGVRISEINIPLDKVLKGAYYSKENHILTLTFNTDGDIESAINIDLKDLVDVYTAGNGLVQTDGVFNVHKNETNDEGYLTVDASGIYITGINAIKDAVEVNTKDIENNRELIRLRNEEVNSHSTDLANIKNEIDSQKSDFTSAINGLNTTTTEIKDNLATKIQELKDADFGLEGRIIVNETKIENNTKVIDNLKTDLEKHKEDNVNSFNSVEDKFRDLTAKHSALEATTQSQAELINKNTSDIETNRLNITNDLLTLTRRIDDEEKHTTELTGLINVETARAQGEEKRLETLISNISIDSIPTINNAITATNSKVDEVNSRVTTLTEHVENLETNFKNTTDGLEDRVNTKIETEDRKVEDLANTKVSSVELTPASDGTKGKYVLIVDGITKGEINIPSEQLLEKAEFDSVHNELVLVFKTDSTTNEVRVPFNDLVVLYQAGEGLKLTNENTFSIHLNRGANEGYLKIDDSGIYLNGIDAALANQKTEIKTIIDNTKSELETKIENIASKVDENITKQISEIDKKVTDNENAIARESIVRESVINNINGDIAKLENSVNENKTNIKTLEKDFYNEQLRVNTIESDINTKIITVTSGIDAEVIRAKAEESAIKDALETTRTSLNNEMNNIRSTANSLSGRIDDTVSSIATNTNKIATLENAVSKAKFNTKSSSSINLSLSTGADDINVLTSEVITSTTSGNIISKNPDGLYANVTVNYNEATNTLSFSNGIRTESWMLKQVTAIKDVQFDPETKKLIFTVSTVDGDKELTSIDVTDFFKGVNVSNDNHTINLTLVSDEDGVQVLSGDVKLSDRTDNLLVNQNGTLFASKNAEDLLVRDDSNANTSLQTIISKLLTDVKEITNNTSEINNIKQQIKDVKTEITDNNNSVNDLKNKVDNLENKVNLFETKLTNMETIYLPFVEAVNMLSQNVTDIIKYIGMDDINNKPLVERVTDLEVEMDNLIDFGAYTAVISE